MYTFYFTVEDWDSFEKVMDYTYEKHMKSEAQYHPVLMSEPAVRVYASSCFYIKTNSEYLCYLLTVSSSFMSEQAVNIYVIYSLISYSFSSKLLVYS